MSDQGDERDASNATTGEDVGTEDAEIKDIMEALARDEERLGPSTEEKSSESGDDRPSEDTEANLPVLSDVDISSMMLVDVSGLNRLIQSLFDTVRRQGEEIRKLKDGVSFMDTAFTRTEDMRELENKIMTAVKANKEWLHTLDTREAKSRETFQEDIGDLTARVDASESFLAGIEENEKETAAELKEIHAALSERATTENVEEIYEAMERRATQDDLVELKLEVESCARISTVEALQEEVEARATIDGLDEIVKRIQQKMKTRADFLNRQLEQRATLIDFDTLKSQLFEAIKDENASSVERLDLIDEQMSYDQSQFASLQEEVSAKASLTQVNAVLEKIEFLATKEEQEGVEKELKAQLINVSELIDKNRRRIQMHSNELDQHDRKITSKSSKVDVAQLQMKIQESCATKEEVASSMKPLVMKLDQFLGKLVDLDRTMSRKADMQTTLENRDHIQDIYELLQDIGKGGGSIGALRNADAAGGADSGGSAQSGAEQGAGGVGGASGSIGSAHGAGGGGGSSSGGATITNQEVASVLQYYESTRVEIEELQTTLGEIREIIEGRRGVSQQEQHPNHHLWQQMIAFRKLFILTGDKGDTVKDGGASGKLARAGGVPGGAVGPTLDVPQSDSRRRSTSARWQKAKDHIFRTDLEKSRWALDEKQRWLVQNRMGQSGSGLKSPLKHSSTIIGISHAPHSLAPPGGAAGLAGASPNRRRTLSETT